MTQLARAQSDATLFFVYILLRAKMRRHLCFVILLQFSLRQTFAPAGAMAPEVCESAEVKNLHYYSLFEVQATGNADRPFMVYFNTTLASGKPRFRSYTSSYKAPPPQQPLGQSACRWSRPSSVPPIAYFWSRRRNFLSQFPFKMAASIATSLPLVFSALFLYLDL